MSLQSDISKTLASYDDEMNQLVSEWLLAPESASPVEAARICVQSVFQVRQAAKLLQTKPLA